MLAVVAVVAVVAAQVAQPTANQLVQRAQAHHRAAPALAASFEQEVASATFGTTSTARGAVEIRPRSRVRWSYRVGTRLEKSFISDGRTEWAVFHQRQTFCSRPAAQTTIGDALLGNNLLAGHTARLVTGSLASTGEQLVELTPRAAGANYTMQLALDPTGRINAIRTRDRFTTTNTLRFNWRTPARSPSFTFTPAAHPTYRRLPRCP